LPRVAKRQVGGRIPLGIRCSGSRGEVAEVVSVILTSDQIFDGLGLQVFD
jgi:hypothetical protein